MKKQILFLLLTAMLASCSITGLVISSPPGSKTEGTLQIQLPDGTIKTMDKTNLYVKEERIRTKYTVKVRGNKTVKIINKSGTK